jgi:hypothetical protein
VGELGADGKLLLDASGQVYQVNLLEKLLVPLLSKLGNLVVDGGIWLNTQRPEWNDANNALVGQGLSMVTLYYMRRYVKFMTELLASAPGQFSISKEVSQWLLETAASLRNICEQLVDGPITDTRRYQFLVELGQAASRYRERVYQQETFSGTVTQDLESVTNMLDDALTVIDHSIRSNLREDGLYHAYNLLELKADAAELDTLYPMLEGQVAALSSGAVAPAQAVELLEALFDSEVFRADQNSFLLYPDRQLPGFLQKNCVPDQRVEALPLLVQMLERKDQRIIERDARGTYRFNAEMTNVGELNDRLSDLAPIYGEVLEAAREPLQALYEQVFNHKAFTGRSGGMFGFEGLGSIYWHMVSKLLLAVQENFHAAREAGAEEAVCRRLGGLYYRIREGIGFNKTPSEYGAFPTDPYSHTPKHIGAQQPGMTGQVKEEMMARFAELGVRIHGGAVQFDPSLLREREFLSESLPFRFLDVDGQWQELTVPNSALAFTWCQVPLVYRLDESAEPAVTVTWDNGERQTWATLALPAEVAEQLFQRNGCIREIDLVLQRRQLFAE